MFAVVSLFVVLSAPQVDEGGPSLAAHEAQRLALAVALSEGRVESALEQAVALHGAVLEDDVAPGWYRDEIACLANAYRALDAVAPDASASVMDALRARPDPRVDVNAALGELEQIAATLAETFGEGHPVVSERYFFLSNICSQFGRWEESVAYAREAVRRAQLLDGERDAQVALRRMWLGWILRRVGSLAEAEEELLWSWTALERMDARRLSAFVEPRLHVMNYLQSLYVDLGRFGEAEPLLRQYVEETRAALGATSRPHLGGLNNLALFLDNRGRYGESIAIQSECVARALEALGEDDPTLAQYWYNLGAVCERGGRLDEARRALERALALLEPLGMHREVVAMAKMELALVLYTGGHTERAAELTEEAAREAENALAWLPTDRKELVDALIGMLLSQDRFERAAQLMDKSEDLGKEDAVWRARLSLMRAIVDENAGRADVAHAAYLEAVKRFGDIDAPGSVNLTLALSRLGRSHELRGDLDAARKTFEQAVTNHELERQRIARGFERSSFVERPYAKLARVQLQLGAERDAWTMLEASRSRSLQELLVGATTSAEARRHLERDLASVEDQLEVLERSSSLEQSGALRERLIELRKQSVTLRGRLALDAVGDVERPRTLAELQQSLADDEVFLGWFEVERYGTRHAYAWALRQEGPPRWHHLGSTPASDGESLASRVRGLVRRLADEARSSFSPDPAAITSPASMLGEVLLGGLVERGWLDGVRHLVVVPTGFEGLPFEGLRLGDAWVGERWTLSYAPSCSIHALLGGHARNGERERAALVLGDPPFRPQHVAEQDVRVAEAAFEPLLRGPESLDRLERLPRSGDEARAVAAAFPEATLLTGLDASETALDRLASLDELARYSVLHFATHALVDDVVPNGSGVVLSQVGLPDPFAAALRGERVQDGFVSVAEIVSRWRLDADLVTLSACQSALGHRVQGEGQVGLTTAFLQAGARSVLASLWEVQDEPAMLFMRSFYGHWKGRKGPRAKAEALRLARRDLRAYEVGGKHPYAHPAFWAAFVLIGSPD
jgi:CHAT domain-containing protein/tetratricopeptide (TPR) repeat protein